ncbi:FAD-dependent monooxygenase [Pararhizobium mangrovi]|uniref:Monooxygenase n=1 Tax=Pararhizobium mangrovi TaxID=2590452 RepID=A0A506TZ45_9HYPH|nr:FAD-dependent monooxygenase [Pararhizobium mangrovi]TPW26261.1 monooxygenase [Pararhizobium mangrovi]
MAAEVLIVGAGPTGLVLAISLARQGASFRLIDENAGPGTRSRATVVHARTLEFYRHFGFAADVVAEGIATETIHLHERSASGRSREVMTVGLGELGRGLSPYPFILTYPQDLHERLLDRQLAKLGGRVERSTKLVRFRQTDDAILATIRHPDGGEHEAAFAYVCGCDGAHSAVRQGLGIGFAGGTYDQPFYVADVRLAGRPDDDFHMNLGKRLLALRMPVRATGMHRLIGLVPPELAGKTDLTFDDLKEDVEDLIGAKVAEVNWFSRYRVHHRVADRFHIGRVFLLGDAGHVHSPVGGQGMNTGIGDAVNLGWKLGAVAVGNADTGLLDSYEPERIAFARSLVATTDRVFTRMIAGGIAGKIVRRFVAPLTGNTAARFAVTRRAAFRTVSQIRIRYGDTPLSEGKAGKVAAGDRLPWAGDDADNFSEFDGKSWRVHVYGKAEPAFAAGIADLTLGLKAFEWSAPVEKAGFKKDAVYVVRPDGHVGYASSGQDCIAVERYLDRICVRLSGREIRDPVDQTDRA